jgi:hypothetical protein
MLALIGKLTNAAIGWAVPGLSASALYIVAGLLFVGVQSAYAWHKGTEGKAAAIATERAACEVRIASSVAASSQALSELLATIQAEDEDETGTAAEACKRDRFCKSGGTK